MQIQKISTSQQNFGRLSGQLQRFAQEAMIEQPHKANKIAKAVRKINELSSNRIINEKTSSNGFSSIVFEPRSPMKPEGHIKSIRHRCTLGFFKEILSALEGLKNNDGKHNLIAPIVRKNERRPIANNGVSFPKHFGPPRPHEFHGGLPRVIPRYKELYDLAPVPLHDDASRIAYAKKLFLGLD